MTNERLREIAEKDLREFRWKEGRALTEDQGHFMIMEKLHKKATDLGADISESQ